MILLGASGCGSSKASNAQPAGEAGFNAAGDSGETAGSGSGGSGAQAGSGEQAGTSNCSSGDINLLATEVSGTITVNGEVLTDTKTQGEGLLTLRKGDSVDEFADLATTAAVGGAYKTLVSPGTYDLYYRQRVTGSAVPVNDLIRIRSGIVVGASPFTLDIDVPVGTVAGTIKVNGAAVPEAQGSGILSLYDAGGGKARLGLTSAAGGAYSAHVVPGKYDLIFGHSSATGVPLNFAGVIQSDVVVGTAPLSLDIDVPVTTVTLNVNVNGAPVRADMGALSLRSAIDRVDLAGVSPSGNSYSAQVVAAGTYDLYWARSAVVGTGILSNSAAKIKTGIVVGSAPLSLDLDVPATTVAGTVTVNGAPIADNRALNLRTSAGESIVLDVAGGKFSTLVVPGSYDISYSNADGRIADLPSGPVITLKSGLVVGNSPIMLDLQIPKPVAVSGKITVNGAAITGSNQFSLYLGNGPGNTNLAVPTTSGEYSTLVYPGTYTLYYASRGDDPSFPVNLNGATLETGIVVGSSPRSLDIDIPGATVSGTLTVNGVVRSDLVNDLNNSIFLKNDAAAAAGVTIRGVGSDSSYSLFVVPGKYELYYHGSSRVPALPSNSVADLGCLTVQ